MKVLMLNGSPRTNGNTDNAYPCAQYGIFDEKHRSRKRDLRTAGKRRADCDTFYPVFF